MKAIVAHGHGGSEVLRYEEAPIPGIQEGEILVKVYAVSVNHLEIKMVSQSASAGGKKSFGFDLPWIPGFDFAGIVENPGDNTRGFKKGDKVYGNCNGGSYAEYLAVSAETVASRPGNLTFVEAASVPHVGETAWQAVHTHGQLQAGQKVLIHGAAGAVGAFAVQFARLAGAEVYASVAGKDMEYVRKLGASVAIDYETTDFATVAKEMDLVIVLVGGNTQEKSYPVLKKGGRLVSTTMPVLEDLAREYGVNAIHMVIRQSGEDLRMIGRFIESGEVSTDVEIVYPLEDAPKAWDVLNRTDPALPQITRGKIVLEVAKG